MDLREWMRSVTCVAAIALAAGPAAAQDRAAYGGVTPGASSASPPPAPSGAWTQLTWLGFLPEVDGRARVFAQLGRDVRAEQAVVDGELWVMLSGVRPGSRNATRPLEVRFFDTGLASVRATRVRDRPARGDRPAQPDGMKVVVTFKEPEAAREAAVSVVREEDGYHYLYLDFGP